MTSRRTDALRVLSEALRAGCTTRRAKDGRVIVAHRGRVVCILHASGGRNHARLAERDLHRALRRAGVAHRTGAER